MSQPIDIFFCGGCCCCWWWWLLLVVGCCCCCCFCWSWSRVSNRWNISVAVIFIVIVVIVHTVVVLIETCAVSPPIGHLLRKYLGCPPPYCYPVQKICAVSPLTQFSVVPWTLWLCLGFGAKLRIWQVPACKMKPSSTKIPWVWHS